MVGLGYRGDKVRGEREGGEERTMQGILLLQFPTSGRPHQYCAILLFFTS